MNATMFKLLLVAVLLSTAFSFKCYLQIDKEDSKGRLWEDDCRSDLSPSGHCVSFRTKYGVWRTCAFNTMCTDPEDMKIALKAWNATSADCCKGELCNNY